MRYATDALLECYERFKQITVVFWAAMNFQGHGVKAINRLK